MRFLLNRFFFFNFGLALALARRFLSFFPCSFLHISFGSTFSDVSWLFSFFVFLMCCKNQWNSLVFFVFSHPLSTWRRGVVSLRDAFVKHNFWQFWCSFFDFQFSQESPTQNANFHSFSIFMQGFSVFWASWTPPARPRESSWAHLASHGAQKPSWGLPGASMK